MLNDQASDSKVPKFLLGQSLGGLISLQMAANEPSLFNGISLVVPYLALSPKDQALMDKFKPMASLINMIMPTF